MQKSGSGSGGSAGSGGNAGSNGNAGSDGSAVAMAMAVVTAVAVVVAAGVTWRYGMGEHLLRVWEEIVCSYLKAVTFADSAPSQGRDNPNTGYRTGGGPHHA